MLRFISKVVESITQIFFLRRACRESVLVSSPTMIEKFREWDYYKEDYSGFPKILMAAGHGYGNVGDEAQCGACIDRWRKISPNARVTLLSPNPAYTESVHNERSEWAPRVAWFASNTRGYYFKENLLFYLIFWWLKLRLELSCRFIRSGLPFALLLPREMRILQLIQEHDILHISGGGFLTGKTRSRLWENCLLMRCCQLLGKELVLTGHNIGVFQSWTDRRLVRSALKNATWIGLRDRGISEAELHKVGIAGSHILSSCDDALLCGRMEQSSLKPFLVNAGLNVEKPWISVQFHYWGQAPESREEIASRFAELCDEIIRKFEIQLVFIAMTPSDVEPEKRVLELMEEAAVLAPYSPDFRVVRGIIAESQLVFTMKHHPIVFAQGEGVPIVSIALDDYYVLKNKGALENTGHGEFLIQASEFQTSRPIDLVGRALEERSEIREKMLQWAEEMRTIELAPYQRCIDLVKGSTQEA